MSLLGSLDIYGRPRVWITLRGPFGIEQVEAIIDTGTTAAVSVSLALAQRLGLPRFNHKWVLGADGQVRQVTTYLADVRWVSGWEPAEALESGITEVLVGAGLLRGHELIVNYGPAQSVEIR